MLHRCSRYSPQPARQHPDIQATTWRIVGMCPAYTLQPLQASTEMFQQGLDCCARCPRCTPQPASRHSRSRKGLPGNLEMIHVIGPQQAARQLQARLDLSHSKCCSIRPMVVLHCSQSASSMLASCRSLTGQFVDQTCPMMRFHCTLLRAQLP